jgi:hypothetical protein
MKAQLVTCSPRELPKSLRVQAAATAVRINPVNHPHLARLAALRVGFKPKKAESAVVTSKYWRTGGVHLTVSFLDNPPLALRRRIVLHMNAWGAAANVKFVYTTGIGRVRIARTGGANGGYWSYVGTDILHIADNEPTMNLEAYTMDTPESEFHRVVRHETGHTLGSPHEHMRKALVALIDPTKAIKYFQATQGWSPTETRQQVLTPIEESTLRGTAVPDPNSIMCYQIPGAITKNGQPIIGGLDIDATDYAFMASVYPKPSGKPKPVSKLVANPEGKTVPNTGDGAKKNVKRALKRIAQT